MEKETLKQSVERKQKIEEHLFTIFLNKKQINKYYFTPLHFPYDAQVKSGNTFFLCETKVRKDKDISFFAQPKYGPYLELKKIEGMMREKERIEKEKGIEVQMLYFNFATDGLQIYLLDEPHKYDFTWRYLPKDNFNPDVLIWKMVHSLKNPIETIYLKYDE